MMTLLGALNCAIEPLIFLHPVAALIAKLAHAHFFRGPYVQVPVYFCDLPNGAVYG